MEYVQFTGDRAAIRLRDKLDYDTATVVIEEIKAVASQGVRHMDFYCGELQNVSDAGIRALKFITQKISPDTEMNVVMHDVPKPIKDVLLLSGMEGYVEFTE